jgi:hypothetical protein
MPANVRHAVRSRVQSMTSPQPCPQPVRVRAASAQLPGNCRETSETCLGSWRETSHQISVNGRAKVRTKVGAMVRKPLSNGRRITHSFRLGVRRNVRRIIRAASRELSEQRPRNSRAISRQRPEISYKFVRVQSVTVHFPRSVHVRVQTANSPQPHIAVIAVLK